jgi:F0F1-type ATP synthase membrane subunit c/vacuolar-type H+-ATPase subunit K
MHNPVDKMAFLGFIAGIWVGFGGIAASIVAGGMFHTLTMNSGY